MSVTATPPEIPSPPFWYAESSETVDPFPTMIPIAALEYAEFPVTDEPALAGAAADPVVAVLVRRTASDERAVVHEDPVETIPADPQIRHLGLVAQGDSEESHPGDGPVLDRDAGERRIRSIHAGTRTGAVRAGQRRSGAADRTDHREIVQVDPLEIVTGKPAVSPAKHPVWIAQV